MSTTYTSSRDGLMASQAIKAPVDVATTANITLSGEQTIDGFTTSSSRILVKNQTDQTENGIYKTATGAWTREKDFDGNLDVVEGTLVKVNNGTTNGGVFFDVTSTGTITIGTSNITFAQVLDSAANVAAAQAAQTAAEAAQTGAETAETNAETAQTAAEAAQAAAEAAQAAAEAASGGTIGRLLGSGGLKLSLDTDTDHDINITAGYCANSTGAAFLSLSSEITKQIDAAFAAGDDAGGMFTGTVANSTTYHIFLIEKDSDGSIDAGFDTSVTCANIPTGYTKYRRIGSIYTDGSANIVPFHQEGQYFYLDTVVQDFQVNSTGTSLVNRAMSVPTGVAMGAIVDINQRTTTTYASATYTLIHDAQTTDSAASASLFSLSTTDVNHATWSGIVRTDSANGWIQTRSSYSAAGIYLNGHTKGWFDYFDD